MSRAERVGELLKKEISDILQKKISDPRIGFVSITKVDVTDDLRHAQVHVSVFEDEEKKDAALQGLRSATGFIRSLVAPHLDLRFVPEIAFKLDNSIEKANRVFAIMHSLKPEKKIVRKKKC
jgi:ribosome-binding factor A